MTQSHVRTCLFFAAFTCLFAAPAQEIAKQKIPPAAVGILTQLDKEVIQAKRKAIDSLERVLKETTKRGDLASALAVKQEIDRLSTELGALSAGRGESIDIVGRWKVLSWIIEFFPDGTASLSDGTKGTWTARGSVVEVNFPATEITHHMEKTATGYSGIYKSKGKVGGALSYVRE